MKSFWTGFLLSLSLCLDLGVVNVAVLRTSLQYGARAGLLVGVGSCIGDVLYFGLAVMGAAALLQWSPVRWTLWIAGTAVLLWLAWRMLREALHPRYLDLSKAVAPQDSVRLLATGAGLAVASPTGILWFAAVGGSVIASFGRGASLWSFAAGFAAAGIAWTAVFAFAAARLRTFGSGLVRALSLVSALLFLYFAVRVMLDGMELLAGKV